MHSEGHHDRDDRSCNLNHPDEQDDFPLRPCINLISESSQMPAKRPYDTSGAEPASRPNKKQFKFKPLSTELPADLSQCIEAKEEGITRLASLNINSVAPKGGGVKPDLVRWVRAEDPCVLALQEIKSASPDLLKDLYQYRYFSRVQDKAKHGLATLSKIKPINVHDHSVLEANANACEGRFLSLEFADAFVINVYAPMSGAKLERLTDKLTFNSALQHYLETTVRPSNKKVICMGDFNCIPEDIDTHKAAGMFSGDAGRSERERSSLRAIMNPSHSGAERLIDIWRHTHPDVGYVFSYYHVTYRSRNIGMRLDLILISESLVPHVKRAHLRRKVYSAGLSDHCPVTLDIDIKL